MKTYRVMLTDAAAADLEALHEYVFVHDHPDKALALIENIEAVFSSLATFPERGAPVRELLELGIREYWEVFYKPYRIIYRIDDNTVYVMLITDGRRDMRSLLEQRLLMS